MTDPRTEQEIISEARSALSACSFTVGRCADEWTDRYARGRTDADFGELVGLSGDQVYERRRVFQVFGEVSGTYRNLKWSHFRVALTWNDCEECFAWAEENKATVAEMKAWRRMQHGEDLTVESEHPEDRYMATEDVSHLSNERMVEHDPAEEAVTLDSVVDQPRAERATKQEAHDPKGEEGWKRFLNCIHKYRRAVREAQQMSPELANILRDELLCVAEECAVGEPADGLPADVLKDHFHKATENAA